MAEWQLLKSVSVSNDGPTRGNSMGSEWPQSSEIVRATKLKMSPINRWPLVLLCVILPLAQTDSGKHPSRGFHTYLWGFTVAWEMMFPRYLFKQNSNLDWSYGVQEFWKTRRIVWNANAWLRNLLPVNFVSNLKFVVVGTQAQVKNTT